MRIWLLSLLALASCAKHDAKTAEPAKEQPTEYFLARAQRVNSINLELPKDTRIINDGDSVIRVTLPKGFSFFTGNKSLPYFNAGTYKCVCSESGSSCKVFYQEELGGFGCIHSSCPGTCLGNFVSGGNSIIGVLRTDNAEVTARVDQPVGSASLTPGAKEQFFERADVQSLIAEQYATLYGKLPLPDFDKAIGSPEYVFVQASLYGVDFYLLAPASVRALPYIITLPSSASCYCSFINGGDCKKKSKGLLGYHIYWCEGSCNGCALNIN